MAATRNAGAAEAGGLGAIGRDAGAHARRGAAGRALARTLGALALGPLVFAGGCHWHDDDCWDCDPGYHPDVYAPAAPRGVASTTGDESVEVRWLGNTEHDLAGYRIYRNDAPTGRFDRLATLGRTVQRYTDRDVRNGETYYYAVAAFDEAGNESDLSSDLVFDTPRPAGRSLRLRASQTHPRDAGYDFSGFRVVDYRDLDADVYYWFTEDEGPWLVATERSNDQYTDIQDAGFARLDDVGWAPDGGWAPSGDVPLIEGHVYVVWTWDDHYAKVRVVSIAPNEVVLDWAYQVDRGNPELSHPGIPPTGKTPGGGDREHRAGPGRR